jgi:hypothetical protein
MRTKETNSSRKIARKCYAEKIRNRELDIGAAMAGLFSRMKAFNFCENKSFALCRRRFLMPGLMLAFMAVLAWLYATCIDTQKVGFLYDDGIYVAVAKALAEGKGLILLNLPGHPAQVKYPIVYPLLLSWMWRLNPHFPENIPWLQGLTTGFVILAMPLFALYCRQCKQLSRFQTGLILLLTASSFYFIFYVTALMSEAPYFFFSLLTLFVTEKYLQKPCKKALLLTILLSALTFHTRTIGLALIAGIFAWLILQRRVREALVYVGLTGLLTALPWQLWIHAHAPSVITHINYPIAHIYGGYGLEYGINSPKHPTEFLSALLEQGLQPLLEGALLLLFPGVSYYLMTVPILISTLALGLGGIYLLSGLAAIRQKRFSPSALYLAFYVALLTFWMYANQNARFLAVITPWLWLYLFGFLSWKKPVLRPVLRIVGVGVLALFTLWPAWGGYQVLHRIRSQHLLEPSGKTAALWTDYQAAFAYLRARSALENPAVKTQTEPVVATMWDPVFYLYTGAQTFGLFTAVLEPDHGKITERSFDYLAESMAHYRVRYLVVEPFLVNLELQAPANPVAAHLLKRFPQKYQLVYTAPHGMIQIYRTVESP